VTPHNINHHPADDILLKYVAGQYDTAFNLVLATHVSQCLRCQNSIALQQEVGGQLLSDQEPQEMKLSAMDLLDKRENDEPLVEAISAPAAPQQSRDYNIRVPNILAQYLSADLDQIKWQKLAPGLKQHVFNVEGKTTARLISIAAGKAVPPHGHNGEEMTMILAGGYYDGDEAYTKGDLHIADHKTPHVPTAMDEETCLVLAATDAPLIFKGIIPRLLQPRFNI